MSNVPPAGDPVATMDEEDFYAAWDGRTGNPLAEEEIRSLAKRGLIRLRTPDGEVYDIEFGPDGRPRRTSQF